jgi:hypothetical protein
MTAQHIKAAVEAAAPPDYRFKLVPFNKVTLRTSAAYLVRDFIPREGLILVWGPPKSGKSFKVFDIEMHIALGWDYRGYKVKQGPVVHVACEGEQGIGGRVAAFQQRFLDAYEGNIPVHIVTARLDLIRDHAVLIQNIRDQVGEMLPVVVTLDTLNRSLVGSENSDEDMGAYIKAAEAIREAFGCAVIVIHHCGHNGERPRGHSSLLGSLDCEIAVSRLEDGPITLRVVNMKDGPEGAESVSRLEIVIVGVDDDGQDITSCVVMPTEAPLPAPRGKRPIPGDYARAREVLADAIVKSGIQVSVDGIPSSARVITVEAWKIELRTHGLIGEGGKRDGADARSWMSKMKRRLIGDNLIREAHPYVWLCK